MPVPPLGPAAPEGPIPQLGAGVLRDHGNLEIEYVVIKPVWETRQHNVVVNGLRQPGRPGATGADGQRAGRP